MRTNWSGALPARFRRPRVLIVGCGDVGLRVAALWRGRPLTVRAMTSQAQRVPQLRAAGVTPLVGDLDVPATLARLAGLATRVLHLAPPRSDGVGRDVWCDTRSRALALALARHGAPQALVYASTSGVYGDCAGAKVPETRPAAPATARAWRRLDAERRWRWFGRATGARVTLLRIPGIYAPDRPGGPVERLRRGTPVLRGENDVYTNHIHADDLARACVAALWRGLPQRVVHVCDDTEWRMGDYFDWVADLHGLPRPPRVARADAQRQLPPMLLSFMSESRRLDNTRLKRELRLRLRYPDVRAGWTRAG
ncbi:NAD-dependent epimerase/dehydratase family protein [Tepidimonas charontis]|uniref:NAD(P)H-binding protein n=1 Tax=Tepidimonas charontis TaxID=2267262 RepID=A0A554X9K9_9BURK|nr:NAD-dependent epimerase/dehydratase family protein [Tepidimonas charontis]TSE32479.1 NAD(P)H-binding protein [Tepidimonas charontis]